MDSKVAMNRKLGRITANATNALNKMGNWTVIKLNPVHSRNNAMVDYVKFTNWRSIVYAGWALLECIAPLNAGMLKTKMGAINKKFLIKMQSWDLNF